MYIFYFGAEKQFASAGKSIRTGKDTHVDTIYLGRVIDREKGIYKNRERGVFHFDPKTGEFSSLPAEYVPPVDTDKRKKQPSVSVDFGDVFFINEFIRTSGFTEVLDSIGYGNSDTLYSMLLFYMLSSLANRDAIRWYEGNIVRLIYPKANLTSQRISDFLEAIGTPNKHMECQKAYLKYVFDNYSPDKNILLDSSGLPNNIHFPLTAKNVHNGKVSNEVRLIFVVQKSTGLPLYFRAVPGNIVDVSTLERIFLHLDSMGIDISSCIMDAGYNSRDNLDLFYDSEHKCKIGFITRVGSNDATFKKMIKEEIEDLDKRENFIKYEDRYLFIKKRPVMVGSKEDNPAWMYLGLDLKRLSDEQYKLLKRAKRDKLSDDIVFNELQHEGLFGILSGEEYGCEEILPAYYQRQSAEQIFDVAKNYTKLLPLRTNTEETFNGHLLLSYIASCLLKMLQMKLKETNLLLGSRMVYLRNQKCTIYPSRIVVDIPQRDANETYGVFGMKCPASLSIIDGQLQLPIVNSKLKKEGKKAKENVKKQGTGQRGRPKGSKNKKTLQRETELTEAGVKIIKRGKGRPKGSKNKKTLAREAAEMANNSIKKRGRPKGSKNKNKA